MLGDRYGSHQLPAEIDQSEFEALMGAVENEEGKTLLTRWYLFDTNAVPPKYVLQVSPVFLGYKNIIYGIKVLSNLLHSIFTFM